MANNDKVKIRRGDRELTVTQRQYRIYYYGLGYRSEDYLAQKEAEKRLDELEEKTETVAGLSMDNTKAEIVEELDRRGVEYDERAKKEDLLKLLAGE